jgi:hypothetical protein
MLCFPIELARRFPSRLDDVLERFSNFRGDLRFPSHPGGLAKD